VSGVTTEALLAVAYPSMTPLCSIIILNWNKPDLTVACYTSCMTQTWTNREILIIDNASTDDSVARLARECPGARVIRNSSNEGTGGGFAFGAKQAKGDFLLFLCNDTVLDNDVVARLLDVMINHPDCGVCGCTHVWSGNETRIELQGYLVDKFGMQHCLGSNEHWTGEDRLVAAWCSGTVFMAKREAYDKSGGYDPLHFTLNDETDLCWRIRIHGYKLFIRTGARVVHHHFATLARETRTRTRYWAERHLLRTILKNYSAWGLFRMLPQYAAIQLLELVYLCTQRRFGLAWADLRAIGWNIRQLPGTLRWRRRIQSTRVIPDAEWRRECWPGSVKIQWGLWLLKHHQTLTGQ
jgi:GT2 family glycosyltransferase